MSAKSRKGIWIVVGFEVNTVHMGNYNKHVVGAFETREQARKYVKTNNEKYDKLEICYIPIVKRIG